MDRGKSDSKPKTGTPEWWDMQLLHEIALHEQMLEQLVQIRVAVSKLATAVGALVER